MRSPGRGTIDWHLAGSLECGEVQRIEGGGVSWTSGMSNKQPGKLWRVLREQRNEGGAATRQKGVARSRNWGILMWVFQLIVSPLLPAIAMGAPFYLLFGKTVGVGVGLIVWVLVFGYILILFLFSHPRALLLAVVGGVIGYGALTSRH